MSVIIIDPCRYTIAGIRDYIKQMYKHEVVIADINPAIILTYSFHLITPRLVIINDDCLSHPNFSLDHLVNLISDNRSVLFVIFASSFNIRYQELVLLDANLIICSKEISKTTLGALLSPAFLNDSTADNICKFTLSPTERILVELWMKGMKTNCIADVLNIATKTVSSHKGNIKRKLKTHNMQIVYNIMRLSEMLLPDFRITQDQSMSQIPANTPGNNIDEVMQTFEGFSDQRHRAVILQKNSTLSCHALMRQSHKMRQE